MDSNRGAASLKQNQKESYWVEHHNPSFIRPPNPSKIVTINFFHALISVVVVVHTAELQPSGYNQSYTLMNSLIGFHKLELQPSSHLFSAAYLEPGYVISLVCSWAVLGSHNKVKSCQVRGMLDINRCPTAEVDSEVDQETSFADAPVFLFSLQWAAGLRLYICSVSCISMGQMVVIMCENCR